MIAGMKRRCASLPALPVLMLLALHIPSLSAQSEKDVVVARVGDESIKRSELELAAAGQLVELELKKQEVLEQQLNRLLTDRVLKLEAAARQIKVDELVQTEVYAKTTEPTEAEIESFYEANKSQIPPQLTHEQALPQVKAYLSQQGRQKRYTEFVDELRDKYSASISLEPLRLNVDAEGHPTKGAADAPVTIIEFSDFECPYCSQLNETMNRILTAYSDHVRIVFRQFPLTSLHPRAMAAAEASLCAAENGKFWELHDALFSDQALQAADLRSKAESIGLDVEAFEACLSSGRHTAAVKRDLTAGGAVGVTGTPALFVNGRPLQGAVTYEQLEAVIKDELERVNR